MFVAFEGIDGSGKTTVSNLVVQRLQSSGLSVKHLRAEGKFVSSVSEAIRTLARDSRNLELDPRAEFLLYVARDVQLIEEALREAIRTYDVVLADRFLYTADVLGRCGRGLPASFTQPVIDAAANGLSPDLVVLIDVEPVLARARRKSSKIDANDVRPPSRKGLSGVGLQHRVRRGYLERAAEEPERWFVASNEDVLENTVTRVTSLIEAAVVQGARAALRGERAVRQETSVRSQASAPLHDAAGALSALRQWLLARADREPQVAAYLLSGLFGREVDDLRVRLAERVPAVVLAGLVGLTDPVSWELRQSLRAEHSAHTARSLRCVSASHPLARELHPLLRVSCPVDLLYGISGRDESDAWLLREALYGTHAGAVVASLRGLTSSAAEQMRARWFAEHAHALGESYELSRFAAQSVHGVGNELAWSMRDAAQKCAPIASLASLQGLTCERSWQRREQALARAPKIVMQTLLGLDEPRAWQMRAQVASDAKEAIDSIHQLDIEEAWALRERYQDVWPSTVVKSLGALADTERGDALLRRQLVAHSSNVSLLQHAARVALGAHRDAPEDAPV